MILFFMQTVTIYHNSRCSKSRQALEILRSQKIEPHIIEYLKTPLTLEQIKALRAHFALGDFVRTNEAYFKINHLSLNDEEQVLKAIACEPKLMQRPIVIANGKAIIGRPPEKILEILA